MCFKQPTGMLFSSHREVHQSKLKTTDERNNRVLHRGVSHLRHRYFHDTPAAGSMFAHRVNYLVENGLLSICYGISCRL